jgi:hypothetical protein
VDNDGIAGWGKCRVVDGSNNTGCRKWDGVDMVMGCISAGNE